MLNCGRFERGFVSRGGGGEGVVGSVYGRK